jgi:hypothetical protein
MKITLVAEDGNLLFPHGGSDMMQFDCPDVPTILLCRYQAGDCDTCPWPMVPTEHNDLDDLRVRLARALYDEREMNEFFPVDAVILLPDGERFDFDFVLAEFEAAYRPSYDEREYNPDNFHAI